MGRLAFAFWRSASLQSPKIAQKLYLAIAAPTLCLLCFLTGPFEAADEPAHFLRIVAISNGNLLPMRSPEGAAKEAAGAYEDSGIAELAGKSQEIAGFAGHHYSLAELKEKSRLRPIGYTVFAAHSNTSIYPPLLYALPAALTLAAREAQLPPLWWLYLGRLANALVGLLIIYFALRIAEDASLVLFASALLPITIFQMASVSADALLLPLSIVFVVLLLAIGQEGRDFWPRTLGLVIATVFLCVGKVAYLPLCILPPLIARMVDGHWSARSRWFAAGSLLSVFAWLLWAVAVHGRVFSIRPDVAINPDAQLRWIFAHPVGFVAAFLRSLELSPKLAIQAVGARLGWGDLALPHWLIYPLPFLLAAAAIPAETTVRRSGAATTAVLAAALICLCAIFLLVYLQFNEIGARSIDGLQGRYFTPLVIAVLAMVPKIRVRPTTMAWIWTSTGLMAIATSVVTLVTITNRYW